MKHNKAIKILENYNNWRRAQPPYDKMGCGIPAQPTDIGIAIQYAIEFMKRHKPPTEEAK